MLVRKVHLPHKRFDVDKAYVILCKRSMRNKDVSMAAIGYARVSSDGQSLEGQQEALKAAGCTKVYAEKISGAVTDRKALARAIAALGKGDTLVVTRLDRLARSTKD